MVELRPATEAEAPVLRELARAAYARYVERMGREPRPMTDDYEKVLRRFDVTVAERDGEVVGLVAVGPDEEGFVVDNVAVHPEHWGTGAGKALLEHAEARARAAGEDSIYLYTHETMTENIALYGRIGYVEYARRQHGDDVVVYLRKALAE